MPACTFCIQGDRIWAAWLSIYILVCIAVALRPGLVIRVLSYGKKSSSDINARILLSTRIIAAVSVIYGTGYLAWEILLNLMR